LLHCLGTLIQGPMGSHKENAVTQDKVRTARDGAKAPIFRLSRFSGLDDVIQGFSMRRGPGANAGEFNMSFTTASATDHVVENRRAFCRALGVPLERAVFMQQSHGNRVAVITKADWGRGAGSPESAVPSTDAMITRERNVFLAALGADCALVPLCDPVAGVVGIAHAGWRGTVRGAVENAVRRMCSEMGCDPAHIVAGIGPTIGPCCYEVGPDVLQAAAKGCGAEAVVQRGGKSYFDLRRANIQQLLAAGVRKENIEAADVCTACERERFFFSYRRDGRTGGRFCGIIGMRP